MPFFELIWHFTTFTIQTAMIGVKDPFLYQIRQKNMYIVHNYTHNSLI